MKLIIAVNKLKLLFVMTLFNFSLFLDFEGQTFFLLSMTEFARQLGILVPAKDKTDVYGKCEEDKEELR